MRHANDVQKVKRKVFGCERTILSVTSRCIEVLKNVPACLKGMFVSIVLLFYMFERFLLYEQITVLNYFEYI